MPRTLQIDNSDYEKQHITLLTLIESKGLTARFLTETDFDMDYLVPLLLREIDEYRQQSFEKFGLHVSVVPTSNCAPVHNLVGTFIGFGRYVLTTFSEPPKSMRIRFHCNDHIQLYHLRKWCTIPEFMDRVKLPKNDSQLRTPAGQYDRQWSWWLQNRKTFRLLDLPSEIREKLYGFVVGYRIEPYPTCKARRKTTYKAPISAPQPIAALLRLSRQVHEEASHVCFSHTPFFVEHLGVLGRLVSNQSVTRNLRRLQLSLTHYEYLNLFGFPFLEYDPISPSKTAKVLRSLTLNALEFELAPPSLITETSLLDGGCQQTIVDWVLEAAWPYINVHPVKLAGFVKREQKATFELACRKARKHIDLWRAQNIAAGVAPGTIEEYDEWWEEYESEEAGGVSLTEGPIGNDSGTKSVFATVALTAQVIELPPRCRCVLPCSKETWSLVDDDA